MSPVAGNTRAAPPKDRRGDHQETWQEQASSFVGFFIYLLILKSFFLPLFIIPTGSMAETLYGAHATQTCPNCGIEYPIGWQLPQNLPDQRLYHPMVQCPNCRWRERFFSSRHVMNRDLPYDDKLPGPLRPVAGDRIFVHGWTYDPLFAGIPGLGPRRWDVTVFKVPTDGETNYIKRLIGLPGEQIELIDGDVFVNDRIASKPTHVQRALWFPYYNHDYPPRAPARSTDYFPAWAAWDTAHPWPELRAREIRCDARAFDRTAIYFTTEPGRARRPGLITDNYAYNEPLGDLVPHTVSDVRVSAEIEFVAPAADGFVELSTTRARDQFFARLHRDGRLVLEHGHGNAAAAPRATWGETRVALNGPLHLALAHVDGAVVVEADGAEVLRSTEAQYTITPTEARQNAEARNPPLIRVTLGRTEAILRHLLIERDVYYTSEVKSRSLAFGVQGSPIELGPEEYYLLGDNSPNSQDARFAFARSLDDAAGPHLRAARSAGEFQLGTVPADQLIGPAFFVYWPGFMPLAPTGPTVLPDLGRARWIR